MQQSLLLNGIKTKLQTYTSKNCFIIKLKPWLISTITLIYLASPLLPRCVQVQYIGVGLTWLGLCVWRPGWRGWRDAVVSSRGEEEEEAAPPPPPSLQPAVCHRTPSPAHRSDVLNMLIHAYAYSDISVACECYFCTNQPHKTQLIKPATFDAQMFPIKPKAFK